MNNVTYYEPLRLIFIRSRPDEVPFNRFIAKYVQPRCATYLFAAQTM